MESFDVVFTSPRATSHLAFLRELIAATPRGEHIHMSVTHMGDQATADALIRAARDGVNLRLILRTRSADSFAQDLRAAGANVTVGGGCFGDNLHTKFYLFSKTTIRGTARTGVSVVGSGTLSNATENKQENHVAITDPEFHKRMVAHWNDMQARAHDGARVDICEKTFFSSTNKVKAYMFPFKDDVTRTILENFHPGRNPTTNAIPVVRIAMARWTASSARSKYVPLILRKLAAGPCRFELVLRRIAGGDGGVAESIIDTFAALSATSIASGFPGKLIVRVGDSSEPAQNIHSKYFTIEGHYGGGKDWERLVWMGSPNWTFSAFAKNDESMFKIRDDKVLELYAANHRMLMEECSPP